MGKHILVIDDTTDLLRLLRMVLEEDHHQVSVLESGRAAQSFVRINKPDVIVLDLCLGVEASGLSVLRDLKADPETASVRVVIYTASLVDAEKAQRMIAQDPDRYAGTHILRKPFAIEQLLEIVA